MSKITIRPNISEYMEELRQWLDSSKDDPLEEMAEFFRVRLNLYEGHMAIWKDAYRRMAELVPAETKTILDLGCGTGLEIDEIEKRFPKAEITGVDLSLDMLNRLREKHPSVQIIHGDYFQVNLGKSCYDCVVSFESLHHFLPDPKQRLFERIHQALKPGGTYLEVDYLACCQEEEEILMESCREKRQRAGIPAEQYVHFDTPLTVAHEMELLKNAGFYRVELVDCIEGAGFLLCQREGRL